jgi:predicted PurR-regulated permease PerM
MSTEEAKQLIQELEKVRFRTRCFRLLTLITLLVIVITGVSAIINSIYSLTLRGSKKDAFVSNLSVDLHRDLLPIVQKIAGRSLENLKPAVEAEMQRLNARAPEIADVALRELNQMGNELPVRADKILDQTITSTLQKRDEKLRKMYPDIYDQQVESLLNNLALEAEDQLAQSGENIFNPHLNSIKSILANLEKIQKSEPIEPSKAVDDWQVAFLFMDVFVHEFKGMTPPETIELKPIKHKAAEPKSVQPKKTKAPKK